jgi:hypothetical protein
MRLTRLITAQGPLQLLHAIAVLRFQAATGQYTNYDDFLIMGEYCGPDLDEVCLQISRIWNFKAKISLRQFEIDCHKKGYDFLAITQFLKEYINIPSADVIYVSRNWQLMHEICLAAYPEAHKICYGDGLGTLDLNGIGNNYCFKPINPNGFIKIDESFLTVPVDSGNSFDLCKFTQIQPNFFASTIVDSASYIDGLTDYCNNIINKFGNYITVALTSNHTENGSCKNYSDEINCYLLCLLENTQVGDCILIKGHPREMFNQSHILALLLLNHNRNALAVTEPFTRVPIEIFGNFINIKKAFTFFSSSCISLAYINKTEVIIGCGEKHMKNFLLPNRIAGSLLAEYTLSLQAQQAYNREFYPIKLREIIKPFQQIHNFHHKPIYLKPNDQEYSVKPEIALKNYLANNLTQSLHLRHTNLIIFPDPNQSEQSIYQDLVRVITTLENHPDCGKITLLVNAGKFPPHLTQAFTEQLCEEEEEGLQISVVGKLSSLEWSALLPQVTARIVLAQEDGETMAQLPIDQVPNCEVDGLNGLTVDC